MATTVLNTHITAVLGRKLKQEILILVISKLYLLGCGIPGLWDMLPFFLMSFSTALDLTMGLTRWRLYVPGYFFSTACSLLWGHAIEFSLIVHTLSLSTFKIHRTLFSYRLHKRDDCARCSRQLYNMHKTMKSSNWIEYWSKNNLPKTKRAWGDIYFFAEMRKMCDVTQKIAQLSCKLCKLFRNGDLSSSVLLSCSTGRCFQKPLTSFHIFTQPKCYLRNGSDCPRWKKREG